MSQILQSYTHAWLNKYKKEDLTLCFLKITTNVQVLSKTQVDLFFSWWVAKLFWLHVGTQPQIYLHGIAFGSAKRKDTQEINEMLPATPYSSLQ